MSRFLKLKFFRNNKKYFIALAMFGLLLFSVKVFTFFSTPTRSIDFSTTVKAITLNDNGLDFEVSTQANTVADLLREKKLLLRDYDKITPTLDTKLYPGTTVQIQRATEITILADGKKIDSYVLSKTIQAALNENQIVLSRLDKTAPPLNSLVSANLQIIVTRINVEDVTQEEDVAFKTIVQNDATLGWQEKKVTTPGVLGQKEVHYRITYKNGKEVSRVVLGSEITKTPISQVEVHGTYMKLGKATTGQGTWYSYQGGMFAASTTLPRGSYAKVTNVATGKSVVVQINDYGPQGKGRIIDLDKVAFAKIASVGAGVIGVKVEPILN